MSQRIELTGRDAEAVKRIQEDFPDGHLYTLGGRVFWVWGQDED